MRSDTHGGNFCDNGVEHTLQNTCTTTASSFAYIMGGEHSTGLGLSIAKRFVKEMKGRVWCESTLGKGAAFIVELPQQQEYPS